MTTTRRWKSGRGAGSVLWGGAPARVRIVNQSQEDAELAVWEEGDPAGGAQLPHETLGAGDERVFRAVRIDVTGAGAFGILELL